MLRPSECLPNDIRWSNVEGRSSEQTPVEWHLNHTRLASPSLAVPPTPRDSCAHSLSASRGQKFKVGLIRTHDRHFVIAEDETLQQEGSLKIHMNSSKDKVLDEYLSLLSLPNLIILRGKFFLPPVLLG